MRNLFRKKLFLFPILSQFFLYFVLRPSERGWAEADEPIRRQVGQPGQEARQCHQEHQGCQGEDHISERKLGKLQRGVH